MATKKLSKKEACLEMIIELSMETDGAELLYEIIQTAKENRNMTTWNIISKVINKHS